MELRFIPDDMNWHCQPCGVALVPRKVEITYLNASFQVELPVCPVCGEIMIEEELACGRMREVEQLLEDK